MGGEHFRVDFFFSVFTFSEVCKILYLNYGYILFFGLLLGNLTPLECQITYKTMKIQELEYVMSIIT